MVVAMIVLGLIDALVFWVCARAGKETDDMDEPVIIPADPAEEGE